MSEINTQRTILVTGGSRGIGQAAARAFASDSARIVLAASDEERLLQTAGELTAEFPSTNVVAYPVDIADEQAVKGLFQHIQQSMGTLDVLVNAAGIMQESPLAMTRPDDLMRLFQVNVFGSYYCCQYATRLMSRHRSGAIINMASVSGEQGAAGQSAYAASKSAISGMTRALAKELGPLGIRVNAIAPGFIATAMTEHYQGEKRQSVIDKTLLAREGSAEEVAALIRYLASPEAAYITGQVIPVSGGLHL